MRRTTKIILGATVGLVAYDLYAAASPEEGDTLSEVIAEAARRRPIIAFGMGVLCGHWFWSLGNKAAEGAAGRLGGEAR